MRVARINVARPDRKGATEKNITRLVYIDGDEVLGYSGSGREEHSGEPVAPTGEARRTSADSAAPRPRRRDAGAR